MSRRLDALKAITGGTGNTYTQVLESSKEFAEKSSIASLYKPAGSYAFADIPAPSESTVGRVYNITNDFTSTESFVEGAGGSYSAGTNVVVVEPSDGVYKYDILGGQSSSGGGGADWNAQEGEDGYIANKPFYSEYVGDVIFEETAVSVTLADCTVQGDDYASWSGWYYGYGYLSDSLTEYPFVPGDTVKVTVDGQEYTLVAVAESEYSSNCFLGFTQEERYSLDPTVSTPDDLPYLFSFYAAYIPNSGGMYSLNFTTFTQDSTKTSVTVKLEKLVPTYHKIDPAYIPPEGYNTTASGKYSHAEGEGATASGRASHAEGDSTTASELRSHAEGFHTTASGTSSHAEGYNTTASGKYSHAEGVETTASGSRSHAEGDKTNASGEESHAEGYGTTASSDYQHVEGRFNIEDTDGEYAHIVGNGTGEENRSNAYTLDWSGNGVYSGTLTCATSFTIGSTTITEAQLTALLATLNG